MIVIQQSLYTFILSDIIREEVQRETQHVSAEDAAAVSQRPASLAVIQMQSNNINVNKDTHTHTA